MEINEHLSDKGKQDFELVQKALKSDQKAFAELMRRYKDMVYFMMLKMVNNRDDAEDLTLEAFGKAFRSLEKYSPDFAFSTWLFKIASNNCIDFIRKKKMNTFSIDKGQSDGEGGEYHIDVQSDVLDPEEDLINKQKGILLREIVDKMQPRYKQLVEMRYFKEMSYEEISVELNSPVGTVKAQLFRARDVLYNILKGTKGQI